MSLIRYNPNLFNNFDRFFSLGWPASYSNGEVSRPSSFVPRVEIRHEEDALILEAEIPGVDKEGVKVEIHENVLTLSGEKENEGKEDGNYRSERSYGSFSRSFTLPKDVDAENISAGYRNGVLHITLPRKPESKPKLIAIGDQEKGGKVAVK